MKPVICQDAIPIWTVVINAEEQYSIWPADRILPAGWLAVGMSGSEADCLSYIGAVWRDMRPRSQRRPAPAADPG